LNCANATDTSSLKDTFTSGTVGNRNSYHDGIVVTEDSTAFKLYKLYIGQASMSSGSTTYANLYSSSGTNNETAILFTADDWEPSVAELNLITNVSFLTHYRTDTNTLKFIVYN